LNFEVKLQYGFEVSSGQARNVMIVCIIFEMDFALVQHFIKDSTNGESKHRASNKVNIVTAALTSHHNAYLIG